MHINIKSKYLYYDNYKVKCAIGKRGIGIKMREGDLITPKGSFKIMKVLYRRDRIKRLKPKIKTVIINKEIGWCNDSDSKYYNKLIKYPFNYNSEKLYRKDNIYDIILVLNYNMNPIRKNKGSAIFLHIAKKKFESTEGCIAIKKNILKKIVESISKQTKVKIT